jgi:hypothetical protein
VAKEVGPEVGGRLNQLADTLRQTPLPKMTDAQLMELDKVADLDSRRLPAEFIRAIKAELSRRIQQKKQQPGAQAPLGGGYGTGTGRGYAGY